MSASPERPNILLITTDQQRFDALGLAKPDGPLRTTTLDALASGCFGLQTLRRCPAAGAVALTSMAPAARCGGAWMPNAG